ncbi:MAG: fused MFS/spermidine synthase [Candidatus Gastranaerophilales bacterium]|nr:fused MFS/spermidine synthase [Candidatus Gastranaerophilales bacterium]
MSNEYNVIIPEALAILEPNEELLEKINSKTFKDKILFETDSDFHQIKVIENEIGRFLHYKDTYQAGFIDTSFYKGNLPYINYFLIPYFMNPDIKKILLIGMGTGKIVNDFEIMFDKLKKIDVVDIEENILPIAKEYFDFKESKLFNFHLQDGRIFLRNTKTKYDLIVVDVANNDGIDARFFEDSYFDEIKNALSPKGIFVSNLCASAQLEHPKNYFFKALKEKFNSTFPYFSVYKGNYSDEVYYKSFFNIDKRVIDITNIITIAANSDYCFTPSKKQIEKFKLINIDMTKYLSDKV